MKKLFTLVVFLMVFVTSTKADRYVYFDKLSIVAGVDNEITSSNGHWHYNGQEIKCMWDWGPIYNINKDYKWTAVAYGDVKLISNGSQVTTITREDNNNNNNFSFDFTNAGGAIVVTAVGTNGAAQGYWAHYVITVPYPDEHVWNFYDQENNVAPAIVENDHQSWDLNQEKINSSNGNKYPISVAAPGNYPQDNCYRIDGTNAYYIPSTAGLIFNTADKRFGICTGGSDNHVITWGGNGSVLKIPQVPNGYYIKIWWDAKQEGNYGANFTAKNVLDLDGVDMTNQSFKISGIFPNSLGAELKGVTIFKVKDGNNGKNDISFTLTDEGWNDLYRIEIVKDYSTDMRLFQSQDMVSGWVTGGSVEYNSQYASIVHKTGETAERYYGGTPQASVLQRARSCDFEAEGYNGVSFTQTVEVSTGRVPYNYLHLSSITGTGNIRVIQKEKFNGFVLNKKETWIAVGEYTEQAYPYTWDFMDWNMKQKQMLGVLDDSHTHGFAYGYWNTASDNVRSLETHEPVDASKGNNNYIWNNVPVDRPLFAQGAQLSYRDYDASENLDINKPFKEAEGLRMKQYWGDEIGAGSTYDGEISLDGNFLNFNPTVDGHKLVITIPNVPTKKNNEDMWLFVKSSVAPQSVYAATDKANPVKINASVPTKCNLQNDVKAYKITSAGDVEILFTTATSISAIGVTHIFKSINALGYATESRDVDIDHEYEGVFTKNDVNAYCIQTYDDNGFTYEYKGLPLVKKSTRVHMVPKNTGIVLYADENPSAGSQFNVPLFYPACNNAKLDMSENSAEYKAFRNNWMAPCVNEYTHTSETVNRLDAMKLFGTNGIEGYNYGSNNDVCTKFVMSRQYYVYYKHGDGSGTNSEELTSEQEAFYRMRLNSGVSGTSNTMGANKAYLLIPTAKLPLALWNPQSNGEGKPGLAKSGVIFMDDIMDLFSEDEPSGIATAIDAIESTETVGNGNTFHTLSGMQIQGVPTQKGVYIVNGKKVLVK